MFYWYGMPKSNAHTAKGPIKGIAKKASNQRAGNAIHKSVVVLRDRSEARTQGRRNQLFPYLNIRETAKRMSVNESHLSRLLTRKTVPSLKMAAKLADAFGMTIEQVVRIYDDGNNHHEQFHIPGAA